MKYSLMVNLMPISLSRIEREYVLQIMKDTLPPLSILFNNFLITIPEKSYSIQESNFIIPLSNDFQVSTSTVTVFFRHKQRGMFFLADITPSSTGFYAFKIISDLCKDDIQKQTDKNSKTRITISNSVFESCAIPAFPLDCILIDPSLCVSRRETINKIAEKAGLSQSESLVSYRLFEYLDRFTQDSQSEFVDPTSGHFFFIDHQYVLVSVLKLPCTVHKSSDLFSLSIEYEKRIVLVDSMVNGTIQINKNLTVVCFSMKNAQEEDKRFLFEKLYKSKYLGLK